MRIFTHQPFLFRNLNNEIKILFCRAREDSKLVNNVRPWKIFLDSISLNNPIEIKTLSHEEEISKNIIECNPSLFHIDNKLFLSYNKGICFHGKLEYSLIIYEIENLDFNNLKNPKVLKNNIFNGCIKNNMIFCVENQAAKSIKIFDLNQPDFLIKEIKATDFNFKNFIRANPIFNKNKIIFTGLSRRPSFIKFKDLPNIYRSFVFDLDLFRVEREILNNQNESLYKSSVLDDYLAYAKKLDGFENREVIIEKINS